jgi:Fe-S-cluster-containing hydrogenase component 2
MSYKQGDALQEQELAEQIPPLERLKKGPVAIIECVEEIPCNPCVEICPQGAISIPGGLNRIPRLDWEKCNGCGVCVSGCPGLAIFVVNLTEGKEKAKVVLPYEFLPLPEKGEAVVALDREGNPLGPAEVLRVQKGKRLDRTPIITIALPREWALQARNIHCPQRRDSS